MGQLIYIMILQQIIVFFGLIQVSILDSIFDVPSGNYLVTITDLNNPTCYLDTNITISQPQDPLNVVVNLSSDVEVW